MVSWGQRTTFSTTFDVHALGSITAFGSLNWNQQMWLTMNIGGTTTGAPTLDGEMSPRLQLTAVPYAFQAGELGNGTNKATLDASGNLTLQQASTISTSTGALTLQSATTLTVQTAAGGTSSNLTIQTGTASSGVSGSVAIDNGTAFSGSPSVSVGGTNARSVQIGNASSTTTLTLQGGTGGVNVGTGGIANTIQIGNTTGGVAQTVNIGNNATASSTSTVVIGSSIAGATTLQSAGGVAVSTLGAANSVTYLCRNSSNIISTCQTNVTGTAFVQGGNSFGAQAILGTNDANSLAFETSNTTRLIVDTSATTNFTLQQASNLLVASAATGASLTIQGGAATSGTNVGGSLILQGGAGASTGASGSVIIKSNTNNSTTALQVQNASGLSVVNVDTTNQTLTARAGSDQMVTGSNAYSGNFSSGWTTTGWNVSGVTTAVHTAGNTSALINSSVAITVGTIYEVQFKASGTCGTSSDSVTASIGGSSLGTITGDSCGFSNVFDFLATATTTAGLTFTPTTNWTGTISNIAIYPATKKLSPTFIMQDTTGSNALEVRASKGGSSVFLGNSSGQYDEGSNNNVGIGLQALSSNDIGYGNTAVGYASLQANTVGIFNTAIGEYALNANVIGSSNVAIGENALYVNVTGQNNIAVGTNVLQNNTSGNYNITLGGLNANTTGSYNVGLGVLSLSKNTTGTYNSALGYDSGYQDSSGNFKTLAALQNATAIGAYAQVQANNSIVLGSVDTATNVGIGITVPSNIFSVSPLDYQTGTATRTNGSATLVGTGTTWTSAMVGDIIVFADGTTNTVSAFTNTTHITMSATYTGTTDATPIYYRFHKPGFNVTSAGNAFVQNTSTTAFQVQNASGTAVLTVNTSTSQVTVGGNLSVTGNTAITGAISSLGGTSTVGSFGVPAVIAQGNYTDSATGLNAIYNSGNMPQGWYRVSLQLKNTVASGSTFCYIVYTDADTGSSNNVFPWFDRSTDGAQVTMNGTVNMTVAVYTGTPISLYTSNNTSISIVYGVTGATPTADKVHYVVERMY